MDPINPPGSNESISQPGSPRTLMRPEAPNRLPQKIRIDSSDAPASGHVVVSGTANFGSLGRLILIGFPTGVGYGTSSVEVTMGTFFFGRWFPGVAGWFQMDVAISDLVIVPTDESGNGPTVSSPDFVLQMGFGVHATQTNTLVTKYQTTGQRYHYSTYGTGLCYLPFPGGNLQPTLIIAGDLNLITIDTRLMEATTRWSCTYLGPN